MIDKSIEEAQVRSQTERKEAQSQRKVRNVRIATIIGAFAVGVLVASGVAAVLWYYYPNQATSSSSGQNPTPPSGPAPGTYWYNTSFSGDAIQMLGGCVATPGQCTTYWFDFNVSCPTGNLILIGSWTDNISGGFPTVVRISSGGVVLATSGGDVPYYGSQNASWGNFDVTAHGTVFFRMLSAWDMNEQISISGESHSWSVIL